MPDLVQSRLHRSTVLVLLLGLSATLAGFGLLRNVVMASEIRLLRQQATEASLVLSSVFSQTSSVTSALAQALGPDGRVDQARFQATASALMRPPTAGGGGYQAVALVDTRTGRPLAFAGGTLRTFGTPAVGAQLAAAVKGHPLALLPLVHRADSTALSYVAPAGPTTVAYVETVLSGASRFVPQLPGAPFSGVDVAVYLGTVDPRNLVLTTTRTLPLRGRLASTRVSPTVAESYSNAPASGDNTLVLVMRARAPLTGTLQNTFPWILLAFGAVATLITSGLLESSQRRQDRALALVAELETRNEQVARAVARQTQAEQQLRQAQRMEAVGQLAGGIAHDFNNLLAVMFSYLGFLRQAGAGQPWLEDVEEVDRAAKRAAELTQQLLMFSRRDTAKQVVVDLRALLAERHSLLQRTLREDIEVVLELPEHPMPVVADAVELDQVVMNLAVNARDAMPVGGLLTLSLDDVTEHGEVSVRLRVQDTGKGMPPEVAEHAFEPFFTTKEVGRGTGLGLATVYGIVTRAGGSVSIASRPGEGTTITALLPRSDRTVDDAPAAAPVRDENRGQGTVLVVEDQEAVLRAVCRILREAGYDVLEAQDGPAAMELFTAEDVDLVVTDVVMPGGVSGPDLVARMRQIRPQLPAILTSGYSGEHLVSQDPLPPDTQLLSKPYPAEHLVDAVRRGLEQQGART